MKTKREVSSTGIFFLKSGFLVSALVIVMLLFVVFVAPVSAAEHQVYEGMTSNSDSNITSTPEGIGSGMYFERPVGIAVEADGQLVVTDIVLDAVVRVDPVSGNRTVVSDNSTGSGICFKRPVGIAVEADGSLVVVDKDLEAVVRVDPVRVTVVSFRITAPAVAFALKIFEASQWKPMAIWWW